MTKPERRTLIATIARRRDPISELVLFKVETDEDEVDVGLPGFIPPTAHDITDELTHMQGFVVAEREHVSTDDLEQDASLIEFESN